MDRSKPRYFDDFEVGEMFESERVALTETDIVDFACLYDPQPIHIDKEAATAGPYGGLIASGFQTMALIFSAFYSKNVINEACIGGPSIDEVRFLRPVRPADTIVGDVTVIEKRESRSKPDRGYLRLEYRVRNQHEDKVMTFQIVHILLRCQPD